jgi:hypothetical protein
MEEEVAPTEESITTYIKDIIIEGINESIDIEQHKNQINGINTALEKLKVVYKNSIKEYNNKFTDEILDTYSISKLKDMYDNTNTKINLIIDIPYINIKRIYFDIFLIALFNKKNYLFNKVFLSYDLLNTSDNTEQNKKDIKEVYDLLYKVYYYIINKKVINFIETLNNLNDILSIENEDQDIGIYLKDFYFTKEIPILDYLINESNSNEYSNIQKNIKNIKNITIEYPFLYINITNFDYNFDNNYKLLSYFESVDDRILFDIEFPFILNVDKHHLYLNSIILVVEDPIYYICIYEVNNLWYAFYYDDTTNKYKNHEIGVYDAIFKWNGPGTEVEFAQIPHNYMDNFVKKHVIGLFYV